jgi:hypothetical protein
MAITHTAGITFSSNNGSPTVFSISQAADGEINLDVVIAAAASNFSIVCPISSSLVKSVLIYADAAMTVLTKNSGGTTVNTFTMVANKPLLWQFGFPTACPITGDCATLSVTSTPGGNLRVSVLEDV